MAERVINYCDRCGEEFKRTKGWTARVKRKCSITLIWYGMRPIEHNVELCRECTKKLDEFFKSGRMGAGTDG